MRPALPVATSPVWLAGGALVTGASTYLTLILTARGVTTAGYDDFSFFWSAMLVAAFGAFLPVEQVLARRRAAGHAPPRLLASGTAYGGVVGVLAVVVVLGLGAAGKSAQASSPGLMAAVFALTMAGFVPQFAARGLLAGEHRLLAYTAVLTVDSLARVLGVSVLVVLGVSSPAAYALVVAGSAVLAGLLGVALVRLRAPSTSSAPAPHTPPRGGRPLAVEVAGLMVAMLCMQALLNSPVLLAGGAGRGSSVSAGELLAVTSLARLAVFVAQGAQAGYVGRIAAARHAGRGDQVRRLVTVVAGGAVALAAATLVAAPLLGPALVRLLFGGDFDVTRTECLLVAAGMAAYVVASVANDLTVALARHHGAGPVWLAAALVGLVTALLADDPLLRATLPLLTGATTAGLLLVTLVGGAALRGDRGQRWGRLPVSR